MINFLSRGANVGFEAAKSFASTAAPVASGITNKVSNVVNFDNMKNAANMAANAGKKAVDIGSSVATGVGKVASVAQKVGGTVYTYTMTNPIYDRLGNGYVATGILGVVGSAGGAVALPIAENALYKGFRSFFARKVGLEQPVINAGLSAIKNAAPWYGFSKNAIKEIVVENAAQAATGATMGAFGPMFATVGATAAGIGFNVVCHATKDSINAYQARQENKALEEGYRKIAEDVNYADNLYDCEKFIDLKDSHEEKKIVPDAIELTSPNNKDVVEASDVFEETLKEVTKDIQKEIVEKDGFFEINQ